MQYLVKVDAGDGKVETYTTEATDAAAAMLQAYDKYGVCGVMVSPAPAPTAGDIDASIAKLDALLAERRASTMDHAQLAALGREKAGADEAPSEPWLTRELWTHVNNAAITLDHLGESDLSGELNEVCAAANILPAPEAAHMTAPTLFGNLQLPSVRRVKTGTPK